jgi:hypothetical protein
MSEVSELILSKSILPEPLARLICAEKIRVREVDGTITLTPLVQDESEDYISKLRGSCADKLTSDKFLAQKRADKELEA